MLVPCGFEGEHSCLHPNSVTYVIAAVPDSTPGSLAGHQKVHLGLSWAWAVQRLPASVDRVLHLLPEENPTTVMLQQIHRQMEFSTDPNHGQPMKDLDLFHKSQNCWSLFPSHKGLWKEWNKDIFPSRCCNHLAGC